MKDQRAQSPLSGGRQAKTLGTEAIAILPYKSRVFDVRALVQRRKDGQMGSHGSRRPAGSSPPQGEQYPRRAAKRRLWSASWPRQGATEETITRLKERIVEIALAAAEAVARSAKHVAELGVDLAIDTEYRCCAGYSRSTPGPGPHFLSPRAGLLEEARAGRSSDNSPPTPAFGG